MSPRPSRLVRGAGTVAAVLAVSLVGTAGTLAFESSRPSAASNSFAAGTLASPSSLTTIHPNVTGSGDGNVTLTWSDSLTRSVTFKVERALASSPTSWATVNGGGSGQPSSALCTGPVPGTVSCSYVDNAANSTSAPAYNSQYVYQVVAGIGGWSEASAGDLALSLSPASGTDTYLVPSTLNAVSAQSGSSVWAVGANCTVDYYNGSSWITESVPSSVCPAGTSLNGVAANSGSPMIVGSGGLSFICTASCSSATPTWTAKSTGTTNSLNAVSAYNSSNMWAVGANCTILYFNGTGWSSQSVPNTACPSGTTLNGVSANAFGPNPAPYAVGNGGLLLLCSGGPGTNCENQYTWGSVSSGTTKNLYAVSTAADNYDVAVGASGTTITCTGGCDGGMASWGAMTSGTSNNLYSVYGQSTTNFLAVGASGSVLQCSASCNVTTGAWSSQSSGTTSTLSGVVATGSSSAWAVGAAGTIVSEGTSSWQSQSSGSSGSPTTYTLSAGDLANLAQPDSTYYTDRGAWPSAALGTSCTAGTNPGVLVRATATIPSGYSTITTVVATVVFKTNATPASGAAFQLLASGDGGATWTAYALNNPGSGGAAATTSVTITSSVGTVSKLQNMALCFQGSSGSGQALTTSIDLIHVDVN